MNKTKRRSAIVVITSVLLLGALALSTGVGSQESSVPLDNWNGTRVNVGTMLDDPAMDVVYEAIADAANAAAGDGAFSTDDAKSFLDAMLATNFGDLGIAGNTTTYYNVDGTVRCKCEYESAGAETVSFDGQEFDWYKFELTSEDAACSEYEYLILTEIHSHEGAMVHFHMRYGNTSFDDLINNTNYAMWWPTFGAEGTTAEEVADGFAEGAVMLGYMMEDVFRIGVRPRIMDPANGSFVYGIVPIREIEINGATDIISNLFEYSIDGEIWTEIGTDYNGCDILAAPDAESLNNYECDGWMVEWDTSTLREAGLYYIKATMTNEVGDTGTDTIQVYVDPTPPQPTIYEPLDGAIVSGIVELRESTLGDNIVYNRWEYQLKPLYYVKGVTEKDQHDYGGTLGGVYCVPTSSASCLDYWAANGFSNLKPPGMTQSQLVEALAKEMKTTASGTWSNNFEDGLRQYIKKRGYGCNNPDGMWVVRHNNPSYGDYRRELEANREDVLVWVNGSGIDHVMTGNSLSNVANEDETYDVDFMDPWTGDIINTTMTPDGSIWYNGRWSEILFMLTVSPKNETKEWDEIKTVDDPGDGWLAQWNTTGLKNGYYGIRATMNDGVNELSDFIVVQVDNPLDPWKDFDPNHLPTCIINISGEYICTSEAMYLDTEGNLFTEFCPPYQEEGGEWTFEQHGSLLLVTLEEEGEEGVFYGSTAGDNIMLAYGGYQEIPGMGMWRFETTWTGEIHDDGEEIVMNAIMRGYDSDNNLVLHWAGTQVLNRVED